MANKNGLFDIGSVYQTARDKLFKHVSRFYSSSQEVEDVVQEAFVKVIEAQHKQQRDIQYPDAYLQTTARNIVFNRIKTKEFRLTETMGGVFPESDLMLSASMEEQFEQRENFEVFCRAVRSLPLKCRRAYVLSRVYGFTNKEVAEQLGLSLKGVEGHLARGTRRCIQFVESAQSGRALSKAREVKVRS
jgi:RNA polymerase sigma-70 factor (ECF subfamily)